MQPDETTAADLPAPDNAPRHEVRRKAAPDRFGDGSDFLSVTWGGREIGRYYNDGRVWRSPR